MLKSTCQFGKKAFLDIVFDIAIEAKKGKHRIVQARSEDFQGHTFKHKWSKFLASDLSPFLCIRTVQAFSTCQEYCQKSISGEYPQ